MEMERVAIIDLGSNTARLIALGYQVGHSYQLLDELREGVRLSEGMGEGRILRAEAAQRALTALAMFKSYCYASGITTICATATSAVREAQNSESFLAAARERAGLDLRVLSGEAEARYGVLAVANSFALADALVLDLGGGSAQLSLMRGRRFARGGSWPLGAVRTTEAFLGDPPKKKALKALQKEVRRQLSGFFEDAEGLPLVCMGGTVRNLANVVQQRSSYPIDLLHGYRLGTAALGEVVDELAALDLAARRSVSDLNPDRADIIVAGGVVIREIAALAGADELLISGQGLREGLFYPYLFPQAGHLASEVREFSVRNLMRRYHDAPAHNEHVARLALELFDGLVPLHGYGPLERELLRAAALLHDIGMAINYYDHHKHGFFLVMSAALPGFSHREQALIALLVRYHRKGKPSEQGLGKLLEPGDLVRVGKLSALLRLSEYLERSKAQRVKGLRCHVDKSYLQIEVLSEGDAETELHQARLHADLLESAYGVTAELVPGH